MPAPQIPIDPVVITALSSAGKSSYDIGKLIDANPRTIQRRLKSLTPKSTTKIYRELRADILAEKQRQLLMLSVAPAHKNARDQRDLATTYGIYYDKERLERGQSTSNQSIQMGLSDGLQASVDRIIARATVDIPVDNTPTGSQYLIVDKKT